MPELGGVRGARVSWLVSGGVMLVLLLLTATAAVAVYTWPFGDSAKRGRTHGWEGRPEALMKNAEEAIDRGDDASARRSLEALIRQHGRSPLASEAKRLLVEMERRELEAAVLVEEAARRRKAKATPALTPSSGAEAAVSAKTGILGLRHAAIDKGALSWRLSVPRPSPFPATFDRGRTYFAKIRTTRGDMTVRLFPDLAPMHATSFVYLAELGFYDDLPFHRACSGFMIQGGDPSGLGTGGPAYRIPAEISTRAHVKGVLSAARASDLDSAGSQFFLMFGAAPALDRQYTVFGAVTEGIDTLDALEREAAVHDPKGVCRPRTEDRILSIRPFTR